tara:strand:- start:555 stop:860 length:306 start_codon:yes stop_codon:yes gene_type:complete
VGCIGSYEERKAQSLLLKAAKKLIDDGRLPNIHCLLVGEGPDKEMLTGLIDELGIGPNVSLCDFTKEPFYVFEREPPPCRAAPRRAARTRRPPRRTALELK